MTPQTENVIRHVMPDVLLIAGMKEQADALRSLKTHEENAIQEALELLEVVQQNAIELDHEAASYICEVAFWGQAALVAALEFDTSLYELAMMRVDLAMQSAQCARQFH